MDKNKKWIDYIIELQSLAQAGLTYGHVGIYIGDGKVMDNIGVVRVTTLDDWIATFCKHHPVGFGFPPNVQRQKGVENVNRELNTVNKKIQKLLDKKVQIDKDLEPLFIRKDELLDQEYVVICRENNITLEELVKMFKEKKEKEKYSNEKQIEE